MIGSVVLETGFPMFSFLAIAGTECACFKPFDRMIAPVEGLGSFLGVTRHRVFAFCKQCVYAGVVPTKTTSKGKPSW